MRVPPLCTAAKTPTTMPTATSAASTARAARTAAGSLRSLGASSSGSVGPNSGLTRAVMRRRRLVAARLRSGCEPDDLQPPLERERREGARLLDRCPEVLHVVGQALGPRRPQNAV